MSASRVHGELHQTVARIFYGKGGEWKDVLPGSKDIVTGKGILSHKELLQIAVIQIEVGTERFPIDFLRQDQ